MRFLRAAVFFFAVLFATVTLAAQFANRPLVSGPVKPNPNLFPANANAKADIKAALSTEDIAMNHSPFGLLAALVILNMPITQAVSEETPNSSTSSSSCELRRVLIENFDEETAPNRRIESISSSRIGPARWTAHTPWNGDFGDARFMDPLPGGVTNIVPTPVQGEACSGVQIVDVNVNGKTIPVAGE